MVKSKLHSFNEEQKLNMSQAAMELLLENMISQFSYYRMVYDAEGCPVDYIILSVNQAFELETGKSREEVIGKNVLSIYPETEPYWIELFGRVAKSGVAERFTSYSEALHKWYSGLAYSPKPDHVAITLSDQTGFFEKHNTLEQTSRALEAQQLENFRLAHEEPITGLPNRVCLYEAIAQRTQRVPSEEFVVSIIAPDNLAGILASYGSLLSDAIMRGIAQRLNQLFPESGVCYSMTGTDLVLLLSLNC